MLQLSSLVEQPTQQPALQQLQIQELTIRGGGTIVGIETSTGSESTTGGITTVTDGTTTTTAPSLEVPMNFNIISLDGIKLCYQPDILYFSFLTNGTVPINPAAVHTLTFSLPAGKCINNIVDIFSIFLNAPSTTAAIVGNSIVLTIPAGTSFSKLLLLHYF